MLFQFLIENIGFLILLGLIVFVIYNSLVNVGGREIAVLERKWFGTKMPKGRVVAMSNEIGIQARTLGPGLHLLIPFLYKAKKVPFTIIGEVEIGLIESIDGNSTYFKASVYTFLKSYFIIVV